MKRYDRTYFDRWHRSPRHLVGTAPELARQAALAVAAAEYVLSRPIRTVLDVGCGEGAWLRALSHPRPGVRYLGVDPSPYVVSRYGRSRRIVSGSLGSLGDLNLPGGYDLAVCADVLHYIGDAELVSGLRALAPLVAGVAYLEVQTTDDDFRGDRSGWVPRSARRYRTLFARAGLVPCGLHLYLGPASAEALSALERI